MKLSDSYSLPNKLPEKLPDNLQGSNAGNSSLSATIADNFGDLPPSDTKRWVVRRKEQVVQAVQAGRLTREAACERYRLSDEEYGSWEKHLSSHGVRGLRVTRLQDYRRHAPSEKPLSAAIPPRNPRMLARDDA